jgi:hypothetical protein
MRGQRARGAAQAGPADTHTPLIQSLYTAKCNLALLNSLPVLQYYFLRGRATRADRGYRTNRGSSSREAVTKADQP